MGQKTAATYHGAGTCQKACCWTPYGNCATGWSCDHHREAAEAEGKRAADAAWAQEILRAEKVMTQRNRTAIPRRR